jgi:hypothetical protein
MAPLLVLALTDQQSAPDLGFCHLEETMKGTPRKVLPLGRMTLHFLSFMRVKRRKNKVRISESICIFNATNQAV